MMIAPARLHKRLAPIHIVAVALACGAVFVLAVSGLNALILFSVVAALAIAGLRYPSVPVAAIVASIPLQRQLTLDISGRSITWTKMTVAAAVIAATARFLVGNAKIKFSVLAFSFGLYVLVLVASVVNARDLDAWATEVYRWSVAFLVYLVAVEATKDDRFLPFVTIALSVAVIGASLAGFYQAFAHVGPRTFGAHGLTRAYSGFGEPNPFAAYLEMSVLLLAALALAWIIPGQLKSMTKRPDGTIVALVSGAAVIGSLALASSQSRGGLLGFIAGMATVAWLSFSWAKWAIVGCACLVALIVVMPPSGPTVRARIVDSVGNPTADTQVTVDNFAVQERLAHWRAGLAMWKDYPFLGVGAGNFPDRFRGETKVWRFRISRGHAHNSYIQAAAQAGLAGLVTYVTLMIVAIATCISGLRQAQADARCVVVGTLAVTIAVMVHGIFDYLHVLSLGLQLSIVWAMLEFAGRTNPPRWPRLDAIGSRA
jgi:O-antigen ligase